MTTEKPPNVKARLVVQGLGLLAALAVAVFFVGYLGGDDAPEQSASNPAVSEDSLNSPVADAGQEEVAPVKRPADPGQEQRTVPAAALKPPPPSPIPTGSRNLEIRMPSTSPLVEEVGRTGPIPRPVFRFPNEPPGPPPDNGDYQAPGWPAYKENLKGKIKVQFINPNPVAVMVGLRLADQGMDLTIAPLGIRLAWLPPGTLEVFLHPYDGGPNPVIASRITVINEEQEFSLPMLR